MNYYLKVLQNYAVFTGRARRKEYWMFALFNVLFCIAAMVLDRMLGLRFHMADQVINFGYIYTLYALVVIIPGLAVSVRRLHDVGKSGWMYLVILIPIIGVIWLIVLFCTDGEPGENKYGPNPKEEELAGVGV